MELNYRGHAIHSLPNSEISGIEQTGMVHGRPVTIKQHQVAQRRLPVGELFYQGRCISR